jgi:RNA polymerase sigma-70 factor (ECF subfamily)
MANVIPLPGAAAPPDDGGRDLAARAAAGDALAARRLLERVAPSVHRVVRAVLGPRGTPPDDVTQDALVAVVHALASFRGECGLVHYACRIAARVAMAARRARAADPKVLSLEEEEALEVPVAGDDPEAPRRRALVRALLDELPEAQAETLVLRVMLGYSIGEVAEAMGVPANTVRSRLRLAKEALRSRIVQDQAFAELLEVG